MSYGRSFVLAQERREKKTGNQARSHDPLKLFLLLCVFRIPFFKIHESAAGPASSHKFPVLSSSLRPFVVVVVIISIPEDQTHFIFRRKGETGREGRKQKAFSSMEIRSQFCFPQRTEAASERCHITSSVESSRQKEVKFNNQST